MFWMSLHVIQHPDHDGVGYRPSSTTENISFAFPRAARRANKCAKQGGIYLQLGLKRRDRARSRTGVRIYQLPANYILSHS